MLWCHTLISSALTFTCYQGMLIVKFMALPNDYLSGHGSTHLLCPIAGQKCYSIYGPSNSPSAGNGQEVCILIYPMFLIPQLG